MQTHEANISEVPGYELKQTVFVPDGDKPDGTTGLSARAVRGTTIITFRDTPLGQEITIASAHDIAFVRDVCNEVLRHLGAEPGQPTTLYLDGQLHADAEGQPQFKPNTEAPN